MNPVILYKKMSHEFRNKLNRELTDVEDDFIRWIVNQKYKEEEDQQRNRLHLYY